MAQRTCDVDGCERKHRGRGLCQMHYKRAGFSPRTKYPIICRTCSIDHLSNRKDGKYCSDACKAEALRTRCMLPDGHQVIRLIRAARAPREAKPTPVAFTERRECAWCGDSFDTTRRSQVNCSRRCKVKAIKNRRRGREHGSTSHYTWAEFMRLFIKFDRCCCAYCEQPVSGQPEPDHVVPLSKGGSNSITNILPSCSLCNADKRDLLLNEWVVDRARLHKSPRITAWHPNDARVWHLTDALLRTPAA